VWWVVDTTQVFKAYDIRGTYPDQLDERLARAVGSAFATYVAAPRIVIARDMRPSGVSLCDAFAEGARTVGVEVVDLGLASTDFLYFAAGHLDAPGAMFTASHNPARYNGIKLCLAGARPIGVETGLVEIEALANKFYDQPASGALATLVSLDLMGEWVEHVRSFVDLSALRPLRILCDTANGMGGFIAPRVFAGLPFEVEIMYAELDGTFPNHPADPLNPENLVDLQRRVLETGADIGLAFDGDADRVFLIDEKAQPISGSTTTAMVAAVMLRRNPGATILYNLICSKSVPEVVAENGGVGVRTRVGHSYIKQVMADTGAVFGGEHSGHYYFRDNYRADSGIITAMIVLELLCGATVPLSELARPFNRYAASGEINTRVDSPAATVTAIATRLQSEGVDVDRLDGLTADYGTWWFNLRPSNTEPLLRLNVEARNEEECEVRVREIVAMIEGK
jgi:phosphomannomutase